eukprot:COSAG02_NODE_34_length_49821_cov_105.420438_13_plen_290_part_00
MRARLDDLQATTLGLTSGWIACLQTRVLSEALGSEKIATLGGEVFVRKLACEGGCIAATDVQSLSAEQLAGLGPEVKARVDSYNAQVAEAAAVALRCRVVASSGSRKRTSFARGCRPKCVASAVPAQFDIWQNTLGLSYLESTEAAEATSPQEAFELIRVIGGHANPQTCSLADAALLDPTTRTALMRHVDKRATGGNVDLLMQVTKDELKSLIGVSQLNRLIALFGAQPNEFRLRRVVADASAPRCIYSGHSTLNPSTGAVRCISFQMRVVLEQVFHFTQTFLEEQCR